jgi:hypothetical protein
MNQEPIAGTGIVTGAGSSDDGIGPGRATAIRLGSAARSSCAVRASMPDTGAAIVPSPEPVA